MKTPSTTITPYSIFLPFLSLLTDENVFPSKSRGTMKVLGDTSNHKPKPKPKHGRGKRGKGW